MADIRPFHGIRYNSQKTGDISSLITPPYDVINPDQQEAFHERNPFNIIRLEFGKELPEDNPRSNKYTRAAAILNEWLSAGILVQEECPAYYLIEHSFPHHEGHKSYFGLVAALRLEEFGTGQVRPTEVTMNTPAADRLNLIQACRANLSPIMGIFDQGKEDLLSLYKGVSSKNPPITATDDNGVTFNLWVLTDKETVQNITKFFNERVIYIADGHHRYRTAMAYRDDQLTADPQCGLSEACNYVMMTLISATDPGLALMPSHRLVKNLRPDQLSQLKDKLAEQFRIQTLKPASSDLNVNLSGWMKALSEARTEGVAFGLYGLEVGNFCLLTPYDVDALRDRLPKNKPEPWRNLDVSLLHGAILQSIMGIDSPEREKESLAYSPHEAELLREIDAGKGQLAFLLNPVPLSSMVAVADAGVRMPPKSTYFYPKTPAGLVINPLF